MYNLGVIRMKDGLAAGITHGKEGRVLTDNVNFSVLAELKFNKDSSVDTLVNILRLEDTLAERLGLNESQPHVDQLMVPIHHSPDQTVIGATALSLALDVSTLMDLEGTEGTSGTAPDTITALSVTFVSASSIPPISTDDYEVVHADGQEGVGADGQAVDGNADPFPNVDDAELNIS
ncbi:hypothetical protein Tco_0967681 [Tanacetum coccineum]